jgi:ATP-dependent Clp protease ATP-binding subunit ClpC
MAEVTGPLEQLLEGAQEIAAARGHGFVGTEHVLLAMTRQSNDSFARRLLDEAGVTRTLRSRIESLIGKG